MMLKEQTRLFAIASIVLAILGFVAPQGIALLVLFTPAGQEPNKLIWKFFLILGPLLGIASVVVAHWVHQKIKQTPSLPGLATALAGMILGYLVIAESIYGWIYRIILF